MLPLKSGKEKVVASQYKAIGLALFICSAIVFFAPFVLKLTIVPWSFLIMMIVLQFLGIFFVELGRETL
jgi:hypothetical protein